MPIHHNRHILSRFRSAFPLAIFVVLIAGLACGLPMPASPTQLASEAAPTLAPSPVPTTPLPPTATPIPLPPDLVESDPPIDAEVPVKGPITFYFNQPMDQASVEAALTVHVRQPSFKWVDDATVSVFFGEELPPEAELTYELNDQIRSRQGLSLARPISLNYRTAGYLQIVQRLPEVDSSEVDPSAAVVASFNRPVVPLGADPEALPAGFTLDPPSPGRGVWLNTSTYIFYPEPALAGESLFTVRTNPGLRSADGIPLKDEVEWKFSTAIPQLLRVDPATEIPWSLDSQVILKFNQPMDRASVEENFGFAFPDGQPVDGKIGWEDNDTQMTFTPAELLPRSTTFILNINAQAQALGGSELGTSHSATVVTVPELRVVGTEPGQGGAIGTNDGVRINFTSGLPANVDLLPYLNIEPAVSDLQYSLDQASVLLYGSFAPNTGYVLRVAPTLTDRWGDALGEEFQLSFRTNPLQPNVSVPMGAEATFLTPQDNSLLLQAVNVREIPLTVGGVSLNDLFALMGPNGYELRQNYQGANPVSMTQKLDLPPDQIQTVQVYLAPDQKALLPGIYYVRLNYPQGGGSALSNIYPGPYFVVVSNIQLTFKLSATDALVWAVDLGSGLPLSGQPISLAGEDGSPIASGLTDSDGIFRTEFEPRQNPYSPVYAITGKPGEEGFGMAFSSWTSGIEPWDFNIETNPQPPGLTLYLYTDRPIYRPGQTVYFRLVARQSFNGRYSLPELSILPITIYGAEGRELATMDLPLTAFGTAHGSFELPDDAQPGSYGITSPAVTNAYLGFQVADYRKPEINLSLQFSPDQAQAGQTIGAKVNARYFFDAPAGNLPVEWALYSVDDYFALPGYQVGLEDTSWINAYQLPDYGLPLGKLVSQGEARTNPEGLLSLEFPTEKTGQVQRYTLEVTMKDESGLPVSARSSMLVHPDSFYIGVNPDLWFGKAGESIGFEVQTADWLKAPVSDIRLRADFQQVVFERGDPLPGRPFQMASFTPRYTPIGSTDFVTGPDALARIAFSPPNPGTYMLEVSNPALPKGIGSRTQLLLWVGGAGQVSWPKMPNSRIRLTSDQTEYRPGDTAQIFIPNPFGSDIKALVTIERSVVMDHQILQIGPGGYSLSLPLTGDSAPNVVVSVTLLGRNEREEPDFRQGFLNLIVTPVEQELNVSLLNKPEKAGPGDEVQFDLLVTDASGKPVEGEFSLSVVDLAALALAEPNSKDILSAFYGRQPAGVRTSLSLAAYNRRQLEIPAGMGGGGDDVAPYVARENFPDTAYWNSEIVSGSDGRATVKIRLPDTLTTWQVEARGLTVDTRVGQASSQVITSKELLIRPVTPRFFVVDDHAQVSAVVQNNSNADMSVRVSLQAAGFLLDDPASRDQTASLPAGGRLRIEWWGTVLDSEEMDLVFSVDGTDQTGKQYQDFARPVQGILPVLSYLAPQTFRTAGTLDDEREIKELISLPRSYTPEGGSLDVELSPSLVSAMIRALDVLESASFESTEQILSKLLANLETYRTLQEVKIQDAALENRLEKAVKESLARLLSRQNYDGGWSWWEAEESDPFISTYVTLGLQRARLAGIAINQNAIDQATAYLIGSSPLAAGSTQSAVKPPEEKWEWDRQVFLQYTLAQFGAADSIAVDKIRQNSEKLSPWAQALFILTLQELSPESEEASLLLTGLQEKAARSATGAFWELTPGDGSLPAFDPNLQTNLSNTAIVLYLLAQTDPRSPLVADTVRYLMANRQADGGWATTYATAWTLIALDQVLQSTGELAGKFAFSAALNGAVIAEGAAEGIDQLSPITASVPLQSLYPDYPNVLSIKRQPGEGRLYYTAGLNVSRPAAEVVPFSQGLVVERGIYPFAEECEKSRCKPIQSGQVGEKVAVQLTLTLPEDMYYLAISDYIPAGAEILDINLQTTQMGQDGGPTAEPVFNPPRPFDEGWGRWLFNEPQIHADHISWPATALPAGTYQLTYTLVLMQPGQYHVRPARAWQLYFPEVQANSAGAIFEIKP